MRAGEMVETGNTTQRHECLISWTLKHNVKVIINTDGYVVHPGGTAVDGGILRYHSGVCKVAFAVNLGVCCITRAELRAAIYELRLAWELGFQTANVTFVPLA
ncbi:hypothetical protein LINGRAHAP2_LOCUS31643 [Linum grandiflorum]